MNSTTEQAETILIVDDEEPVRKTFREWLTGADLGCLAMRLEKDSRAAPAVARWLAERRSEGAAPSKQEAG